MKKKSALSISLIIVALGGLIAIPFGVGNYLTRFFTDLLMFAILAVGWNVIGGYTGYPSFGQVAFFGLGAYATGISMTKLGLGLPLALLISALVAILFAILFGLPVLRLRGHYFAIAMLGAAEALRELVINVPSITEGNTGMILPITRNPLMFYYSMLGILVVSLVTIYLVRNSRLGYGMIAIREDEDAAESAGIDTTKYKIMALALSGVFIAVAGGIHGYQITFIEPKPAFDVMLTIKMIVMSVFGGIGTLFGPVIGAFIIGTISELLSNYILVLHAVFFGTIIILVVVFSPRGLMDILSGRREFGLSYFLENIREHKI